MDKETTARLTQALGVAAGMHQERRQELADRLAEVGGDYDLQALDAARETAYRYVVAASELRGFRWALRQALDDDEIAAMAQEAGSNWDELLTTREAPMQPFSRSEDDEHRRQEPC
ncbi:MAG: hypothetical protein ACRDJH_24790 [Thermomicrobiales bacterium]